MEKVSLYNNNLELVNNYVCPDNGSDKPINLRVKSIINENENNSNNQSKFKLFIL